jgi:hypothetical protein
LFALYGLGLTACFQPISDLPLSSAFESPGANQPVVLRLALIGDTGDPESQEAVLNTLLAWTKMSPVTTVIIFLGDTIYDRGLPPPTDPNRAEAERRLMRQLTMIKHSRAHAIFIPGNHDWAKGSANGFDRLREMKAFIQHFLGGAGQVLPQPGCPGPESLDIAPVRLVFLDTQWWLQDDANKENAGCPFSDHAAVQAELTRLLSPADGRSVLMMGHHPLASHGPHGGYSPQPLKVLTKWLFPSNQDLGGDTYENMAEELKSAFSQYPPLVYASGHDHSLQILDGDPFAGLLLVSGGGSSHKLTPVGSGTDTIFAESHAGFMALEFLENGEGYVQVIEAGSTRPRFSKHLRWKS